MADYDRQAGLFCFDSAEGAAPEVVRSTVLATRAKVEFLPCLGVGRYPLRPMTASRSELLTTRVTPAESRHHRAGQ
jgi:hypothetical protein